MIEFCYQCVYWDDGDTDYFSSEKAPVAYTGICRRHAPTEDGGWPETDRESWCGEGKRMKAVVTINNTPNEIDYGF